MQITPEEIARSLGRGRESRLHDGGWKTVCPAHEDKQSSLTVAENRGKILVRCHAGCTQDKVIKCLIDMELWPKPASRDSWKIICPVPEDVDPPSDVKHTKLGRPVRHWIYHDSKGRLIGYIYRFEDGQGGKTLLPMSWASSDKGKKAWIWKSFDKPRPLYGLDLLAKNPDKPVALFEGEKACDAARKIFNDTHVCISWPGGSNAIRHTDLTPLMGREVVLWPDADEPGFKAMSVAAEILIAGGNINTKMVILPEGLPKGWDVADENVAGLDFRHVLSTARPFEPSGEKIINELNRRYAFVLVGGKGAVIRENYDPDENKVELTYLSPDGFAQYYANVFVQVGKQEVPAGRYWLTHEDRRSYESVVFNPGRTTKDHYNLWRGFSFEPDPTGEWSLFHDHLLNNACQGNEELFHWVFGWFAHMFQRPWKKTGTSLSFRGTQGTGKTIIGKVFGRLIQQHYTLVDDPRYVFGQFNSHMASTLLLHSDEGFWGGDPKHVGKLRSMITSEVQRIEPKGRDSFEVQNFMRLLITTNQGWVVPAAFEERRFAVLDMGKNHQQDRNYFKEILNQMKNGGYAGLLHDLLEFDLSTVDIGAVPETSALLDQKEMSMSDTAKFWFTCLMEGEILPGQNYGWPTETISYRVYEIFLENLQSWGVRYKPTLNEFYKELEKLVPPNSFQKVRKVIGGKKTWMIMIPELGKARQFFDQLNNSKYVWPAEDPDPRPANVAPLAGDEEIPF